VRTTARFFTLKGTILTGFFNKKFKI
jgi:hypothetical protein